MKEKQISGRIYPSVTTWDVDWKKMLADVKKYRLKKISLFVTAINAQERYQLYQVLDKSGVREIPHVHARHDMSDAELEYFIKKYKTKAFTVHYQYYLKYLKKSKYRKLMYIENNGYGADIKKLSILNQVGGVCIDLAHFIHHRNRSKEKMITALKAAKKYKVGCNHLSGVDSRGISRHYVSKLAELDYLREVPKYLFSDYINLELKNPISQQLKFKKYIAKILAKAWK